MKDNEIAEFEMLDLAATAAGYDIDWRKWLDYGSHFRYFNNETNTYWNAIYNGDDALRLAIVLRLDVEFRLLDEWGAKNPATYCGSYWDSSESKYYKGRFLHKGDPLAATCLAITRAAAQIQLSKESK